MNQLWQSYKNLSISKSIDILSLYSHSSQGAFIGDIKADNTKNILAELEFTPKSELEEEEVLTWELNFTRTKGEKEEVKVTGTLKVCFFKFENFKVNKNVEMIFL